MSPIGEVPPWDLLGERFTIVLEVITLLVLIPTGTSKLLQYSNMLFDNSGLSAQTPT